MRRRLLPACVAVNLIVSLLVAIQPARASGVFGFTNVTALVADSAPSGYKFGSVAALGAGLRAERFRFYASGGQLAQTFVPLIYAVSSQGVPGSLLATGEPAVVTAGMKLGWVVAELPHVVLPTGRYLLGVLAGERGSGARLYSTGVSAAAFWNHNEGLSATPAWGLPNMADDQWAFAVEGSLTDDSPTTTTTPMTALTTLLPTMTAPTTASTTAPTTTTSTAPLTTTTTTTAAVAPTTTTTSVPPHAGRCPAFPAFPTKTCTGLPAGAVANPYTADFVNVSGTVVSNVRISKRVTVRANNVTFKNCVIDVGDPIAIAVEKGFNGLSIEDCTIKRGSFLAPKSGFTLRRVLVNPDPGVYRPDGIVIAYSGIGGHGGDVLIEDSYIAPQWAEGDDHPDAIQFWGFGTITNVTLRHNYIDSTNANPDGPVGGAGAFLADGTYVNVTVENNFFKNLQGDTYIHLRLLSDTPTGGHIVRGNRFDRHGVPLDLFRMTPAVFEDNRYEDGTLIPQPRVKT